MPLQFTPSANIVRLKESATLAVAAKARALRAAGRHIIDLGSGEPDFDTPRFIRDAADEAVDNGATHYTATDGILPLREAIAANASRVVARAPSIAPTEVVVSTGSKQSLYNACVCCFGPGDEVLVPTPAWTSYYEMLELARATAVPVFGREEHSLKVTRDELRDAATPRTKGLMICSPSNPTGAVYSRAEMTSILELAAERGWWVIADEIYLRIAYDAPVASVLELAPTRDNLVIINGVAKAYAMTGWRIGWSIAPLALSKAMTAFQSHTTSNAATVSQYATLAALTREAEAEAAITEMTSEFHRRRDAVLAALAQYPDVRYVHPAGAFYLYMNVDGFEGATDPGAAFCERMLEHENVAIVPGSAFLTPGWVRASYATAMPIAVDGITRMARLYSNSRRS